MLIGKIISDLTIIIFVIIAVLGGLLYLAVKYTPGFLGEFLINIVLKRINKGRLVSNLMCVTDGKSHQIDHVYIHPNGIFVIETKNYHGRIYGKANQDQWTQVLAYGRVKNHFYSPIRQNNGHIYALNQILKPLGDYRLKGIVVFLGGATLRVESGEELVVYPLQIKKAIQNTMQQSLSPEEIEKVYEFLIKTKNECDVTLKEHISSIHARQENAEKNHICPKCGKPLVLKNGKYGKFYGCSGYPKCKFMKKAE